MSAKATSAKRASRRFTKLYIASLTAIALLSIVGQVFVQKQIARQATDVAVLTAAQKRQTLCETLLKTTLAVRLSRPTNREQALLMLEDSLQRWRGTRTELREGLSRTLSAQEMQEVDAQFARLTPLSEEIITTAKQTAELARERQAAEGDQSLRQQFRQRLRQNPDSTNRLQIPRLLKAGAEFNQIVDEILQWYGNKAQAGVAQLRMLEFGLLALTIGTLILEGVLIFRPAIRKLEETLHALEMSLQQLTHEQAKSEKLLLNILPEPIANRLKRKPEAIADGFTEATVLFADIVGFTELSSRLAPKDLVRCLNEIFSRFDAIAERNGLEKIKTIGDAYMVVGGLPNPNPNHAVSIAKMAIEMQAELQEINRLMDENFNIRIGINTGPVVAGVIGIKKFIYDLWGDSVNIASRMESHGEPGEIHISESTYQQIQQEFVCDLRGTIPIKGKGEMTTYWLRSHKAQMRPLASSVM
ncbi:adenylate/guanylate cyclase domain-containing protein [filamentous cyanobacterium LEGE 11480]|uniref:Adenylate cyclase n=1 Tax=Romeriopsis navalis LEGE 11480 TaxID=2777977 RepID=A0A928VNM6_9CYAN|nr:adenylate/guanylate cyclase domain-containing protein [Romeriopsis navalis]MBE9030927.1 adenylate/guanylate cyclase domain-containing protein [Romeriopsis navalis LEGE 11480]